MKIDKLYIMLFIALTAMISACSDDDDKSPESDPKEEIISDDAFRFAEVVDKMFAVDSSGVSKAEYVPLNGDVLDTSAPTVYTIGLNSSQEAYQWFVTHCVPSADTDTYASGGDKEVTISFGTYGTITYTPVNTAAMYGIIKLNLDINTSQKVIEIIPSGLWPENESSIFKIGDLVYDTVYKEHFICVRSCAYGNTGILLGFSDKWNNDHNTNFQSFHDKKKGWFDVPRGITEEAWDAFCHLAYGDMEKFRGLLETLKKEFPHFKMYEQKGILSFADYAPYNTDTYLYAVGNPYGFRHMWWGCMVYKLSLQFVEVGKTSVISTSTSLPHFKKTEKIIADHDWTRLPYIEKGIREERFVNDKYYSNRFERVLEAN